MFTTVYACSNCDAQYPKWLGRCSECGQFGTIADQPSLISKSKNSLSTPSVAASVTFLRPGLGSKTSQRLPTGFREVDRVLGGGLPFGSVVLLTGEPGAGKSTLLLALADKCQQPVLYASGEEALEQIEQRASRLKLKGLSLGFTVDNNIGSIAQAVRQTKVNY
ncbi:MAG: ATPase domain-containing protein [Patescibacteria group bacterium]